MNIFEAVIWIFYFVIGIFTFRFLKSRGFRIASALYAGVFSLLAIYLFVFLGCSLSGLLVKPFVNTDFFTIFMSVTVYPVVTFLPYTSMASVGVVAFSLFVILSALAATVEIVKIISKSVKNYHVCILPYRREPKFPKFRHDQTRKYNKPVWICLCRITC